MRHKVRLGVVAPPRDVFASLDGDIVFLQANWCTSLYGRTLEAFTALRTGKRLILDQQHPVDDHQVVAQELDFKVFYETAQRVKADEIIIPDMLRDRQGTLALARTFSSYFPYALSPIERYMFVPQGETLSEWIICLNEFIASGLVAQVIGVPKWLGEERWEALKLIPEQYEVHFLGTKSGWMELGYHPRVRSWDTSLMYAFAQRNIYMRDSHGDYKPTLRQDMSANTKHLQQNIQFARELLLEERVRDEP